MKTTAFGSVRTACGSLVDRRRVKLSVASNMSSSVIATSKQACCRSLSMMLAGNWMTVGSAKVKSESRRRDDRCEVLVERKICYLTR